MSEAYRRSPRDRMAEGREAFARRAWFEAHELWEEAWNATVGPERLWIQGLIQVAAARIHFDGGRVEPCARLLRKALAKLADAPASYLEVDLDSARAESEGLLRVVEAIAPGSTKAR